MTAPFAAPLLAEAELPDQYLASFGKDAAVGCFAADGPLKLPRHASVLLRTPRGLEVGRVLGPATIRQARLVGAHVHGDLIRPLGADDDVVLARAAALHQRILDEAESLARESDLSIAVLDGEVFFDLNHGLLHVLHADPDALAPFAQSLSRRVGLDVRLANAAVAPPAEDPTGCGKPDCGEGNCSTSGGCSTGCGSGCGTEAVDLKPYFSHLRDKMESSSRIPLV